MVLQTFIGRAKVSSSCSGIADNYWASKGEFCIGGIADIYWASKGEFCIGGIADIYWASKGEF